MSDVFLFYECGTGQAQVLGRRGKWSTNELYSKHMNLYLNMEEP